MLISQYGQIFWEIQSKNALSLCFLFGQCRIWTGARSSDKYGVVCYKHPVEDMWVTVHVHRLSAMLHPGYEFDASVVASQLCHNCTDSWSEAHYSGTSDRPAELGSPSLATFPMQTWSNDWELRIQKKK